MFVQHFEDGKRRTSGAVGRGRLMDRWNRKGLGGGGERDKGEAGD